VKTEKNGDSLNPANPNLGHSFNLPRLIVTVLVCSVAAILLGGQIYMAHGPENQMSMKTLYDRGSTMSKTPDPVNRDMLCVPLAGTARELDRALPKNARVFMSNMLGPTNVSNLGYYYFFRNYLFPRQVEISLDGHAISGNQGFNGVPCDSPWLLRSKGFDLIIVVANNQMQLVPLTTNGIPKQ
jgi:hypothetical protein